MNKDFKLKTGDKVAWVDRVQNKKHTCIVKSSDYNIEQFESYCVCGEVVKVLRPTGYKTVYEAEKAILDEEEKKYLSAVIKPFKKNVLYIVKVYNLYNDYQQSLTIALKGDRFIQFPNFEKDTMYKGMIPDRYYTLKELGLD